MIDQRLDRELPLIQQELISEENRYWFDYTKGKFLHNIDTFYYSVKFHNDFTSGSRDYNVDRFRRYFEKEYEKLNEERYSHDQAREIFVEGVGEYLILRLLSFARLYTICLECPEYFHIFFAPRVPPGATGTGESVTCECVVQIRSYMLWMHGVHEAFERSFAYVQALAAKFELQIAYAQENRVDYCWHSNYLTNPEQFFGIENFYKMRVDRYRDARYHTEKVGESGYEIDYLSLGKRGDKCFIRIYLKSKEVVEMGYKPFFFKVWLFQGLINRYDFYCYEECYRRRNWKYLNIARLKFYMEHGSNELVKTECRKIVHAADQRLEDTDVIRQLADQLTPKIHLIMNVEFQTMRKASKSYALLPLHDNSGKGPGKRIYDYLDNHILIANYLTSKVLRLVDPSSDIRKKRCEDCGFWKALRATKIVDVKLPPDGVKLVRDYSRKLNGELVKTAVIRKAVTYGLYMKGKNTDNPMQDCMETLVRMNDNDIENAFRYKMKRARQLNENELPDALYESNGKLSIMDVNTGEVFYSDNNTDPLD